MSPLALAVAALAAVAAALAAAADGALLAAERGAPLPGTVPADSAGALLAAEERDRCRRAMTFARLLGQLTAGAALGVAIADRLDEPVVVVLAVVALLGVVLLAETAARAWGDAGGPALFARLEPAVRVIQAVVAPVARLAGAVDRRLAAALPTPRAEELEREATTEQFRQVVAAEVEVTRDEAALLHGVFSLGDTEVHEIMVPRVNMVGIDAERPWSEVIDRVRSSEHSRFPIYQDTLDEIVGVLHAKDLLPWILRDEEPPEGWHTLVRPAVFVPRSKLIGDQLRDFRANQTHIAFVVDEYGGTAGLVTIEDVLEEIVGEIRDEYDEEEPPLVAEEGRRFWVSGQLTVEELSEAVGEDLAREGITTVGGLVYDQLGRVPRAGEVFTLGGFRVVVERVIRRKVERVYFERVAPTPTGRGEA